MSRPLKPAEADLLRLLAPAIENALRATRRTNEAYERRKRAEDVGEPSYVKAAHYGYELARNVQALSDRTLAEALCGYFGLSADSEEALEVALRRTLEVVQGGRR